MILSLLMWFAMQGQAQANVATTNMTYACVTLDQSPYFPYVPLCEPAPPPAEHVIEIKTRRENEPPLGVNQCSTGLEYIPDHWLFGDVWEVATCRRVTRELYVDGVRWGIVKGLD